MEHIRILLLLILSVIASLSSAAETPGASHQVVAYQTHSGYFVSNRFEADAPISIVVLKDQAAFDRVFGVAMVMHDKSQRLPPGAFEGQIVLAAIHRGKSVVSYQVERVTMEAKTLVLRYTTKVDSGSSAEFACPLIVSVPKGEYDAFQFIEDGKEIKRIAVSSTAPFEIKAHEAGTLTATEEEGKTILSIKGGRGIGQASVRRLTEAWPPVIVVRAYLGGLEQFSVSDGRVKLSAAVASHGGHEQSLHLTEAGKNSPPLDGKSPYGMEIRRYSASGQPIAGLPPKGGWFEMILPHSLLNKGNEIELEWIDFYR